MHDYARGAGRWIARLEQTEGPAVEKTDAEDFAANHINKSADSASNNQCHTSTRPNCLPVKPYGFAAGCVVVRMHG